MSTTRLVRNLDKRQNIRPTIYKAQIPLEGSHDTHLILPKHIHNFKIIFFSFETNPFRYEIEIMLFLIQHYTIVDK